MRAFRVYRSGAGSEWTTVPVEQAEQSWVKEDTDGNPMILVHEFEVELDSFYRTPEDGLAQLANVYNRGYQNGWHDGEFHYADQPCPVHSGVVHGGEAEELRSGIERLIARPKYNRCFDGRELSTVDCKDLRDLLDRIDARDSVATMDRGGR